MKNVKCVSCGKEYGVSSFLCHVKTYHSDMQDKQKAKLSFKNNPRLDKFGLEFIDYIYDNKIVSNFKQCNNYITKYSRHFNNFINIVSKFKSNQIIDVDTFFNFYLPYKTKHPKEVNSVQLANVICRNDQKLGKEFYQKIFKKSNPFTGHDGKLSPWSKDFKAYSNLTQEQKNKVIRQKIFCKDREDFDLLKKNNTTFIEYYLNKGYDEQTAKKMLSQRQSTFSLETCIKKYGQQEGLKKFKQRQEKWIKTCKDLNMKHYSKISQDLFWKIYEKIKHLNVQCYFATINNGQKQQNQYKNNQYMLQTKKSYALLDFYIPQLNKWIEFDGDYWHGQKRGNKQRDRKRQEQVKSSIPQIQLKRVKQRDYKSNPEKVIMECINWIEN